MRLERDIKALVDLSTWLKGVGSGELNTEFDDKLNRAIENSFYSNGWFTRGNVLSALGGISIMLEESKLQRWISNYTIQEPEAKNVGIVMAGNIPLVGMHDLICVLVSGHKASIKLSKDDQHLMPALVEFLMAKNPTLTNRISFTDRLVGCDKVIATGSNNSARYFEYYFRDVPHIIRKNRSSIAILTGKESEDELKELGNDVFKYFGLGCRNVSKILIPKDFDLNRIFGAIFDFKDIVHNKKYGNNYDYYRAYYMLNKESMLENGFLVMKQDSSMHSPVSMLFYDYYKDEKEVLNYLNINREQLQCVVSSAPFIENAIPFGKSQLPELWDYADGVDVMEFLSR